MIKQGWRSAGFCLVGLVGLSGCITYEDTSPYTETAAVCENPNLDSPATRITDRSRGWDGAVAVGIPKGGGALGISRRRTDVERTYSNPPGDIADPAIDAKHQDVVASCKAYIRCMQRTGQSQQACSGALAKWKRTEWEFSKLARELESQSFDDGSYYEFEEEFIEE